MLPTHKTPRKQQLSDLTVLIHGPQKFGKSQLCAEAEGALFLATEPGLNSLEVFQQPIRTWDELLVAAKEIAEGQHAFRTIVIDTVDNAYRMCAEYVCQRKGVEHESDLEYGKGYALVNGEFYRVLNKLALLPYGLFLISHSQDKEIETRTGKLTKVVPTLPEKASKLVLGLVDVILFCDFEVTPGADGRPVHRRVLRTKPSTAYEAGDRTRRLPEVLDCSYAAFAAAFETNTPTPASPARVAALPAQTSTPASSTAVASTGATSGQDAMTAGATPSAPSPTAPARVAQAPASASAPATAQTRTTPTTAAAKPRNAPTPAR